jgi:signal peptidase I
MLKFISTTFYILFVAFLLGMAGLLLGTMLPIPGNIEMKIVKSGSMEPNIPTGSVVVVRPASAYKFGDVITFGADTRTEIPTTHRVIGVHGEGADATYTTKGDANEEADPDVVARRDVIGKVAVAIPYVGFVLDFARQPLGFALLIGVPAALVILEELITIVKETRKWARGNRRREDDDDGDTSATLGAHLKQVYVRKRRMDEIFVPRVVQQSRLAGFLHSDAYGTSTVLVLGLVFTSTLFAGASGGTIAYFHDIERSVGNFLAAGEWGLEEEIALLPEQLAVEPPLEEGEVLGESDAAEELPQKSATSTPPVETTPKEPVTNEKAAPKEPVAEKSPTEPPAEPKAEAEAEMPAKTSAETPAPPEEPLAQ